MRKGITPIISIIVLLLITVALAGVAWTYLSGFLGTQMQTLTIPPNGAYCTGTAIKVVITNTGTEKLVSLTTAEVSGENTIASPDGGLDINLEPKASKTLTFSCGGSCTSGTSTVHIGTSGAVQSVPVTCP